MEVIDKTKFKSGNVLITRGLFYELNHSDKDQAIYTIKDRDFNGCPSLRNLYLEEEDLLEYDFANKYFYNYEHWCRVANDYHIKPLITKWRKELEIKIRSRSLARIIKESKKDSDRGYQATKYLLERGWLPSKSKEAKALKDEIKDNVFNQIDEDFKRLQMIAEDLENQVIEGNA